MISWRVLALADGLSLHIAAASRGIRATSLIKVAMVPTDANINSTLPLVAVYPGYTAGISRRAR